MINFELKLQPDMAKHPTLRNDFYAYYGRFYCKYMWDMGNGVGNMHKLAIMKKQENLKICCEKE